MRNSANVSAQLFESFRNVSGDIRAKASEFAAKCKWGTIDCSNLLSSFDQCNNANDQEWQWATTIADEFAKSSSEHEVVTVSDAALQAALERKSLKGSRDELTVPAPVVHGQHTTSGYANDTVNVATGNFIEEENDLILGMLLLLAP